VIEARADACAASLSDVQISLSGSHSLAGWTGIPLETFAIEHGNFTARDRSMAMVDWNVESIQLVR
jgi:hypothetical protein